MTAVWFRERNWLACADPRLDIDHEGKAAPQFPETGFKIILAVTDLAHHCISVPASSVAAFSKEAQVVRHDDNARPWGYLLRFSIYFESLAVHEVPSPE